MDDVDKLVAALDIHQPDWWPRYATEQDWRDIGRAAKAKDYEYMERLIPSRKRSLASDLMVAVRAAIEAGLVRLP